MLSQYIITTTMAGTSSVSAIFVVGFLALTNAASLPSNIPTCATECPVTGSSLLSYKEGKTYTYSYSGKSKVLLRDIEDGLSETEWSAQVDLTWLGPCDVAITFENPVFDGAVGLHDATFLKRYPLVMAVTDGRVQHVCVHPDDDTWSINMKKGVASTFQNSLPSTSDISSGLEFFETDVVGKCPTKYEVEMNGDTMTVKKNKDHKRCENRYTTQFETPAAWVKAPLPLDESRSQCEQVIANGIYRSITCEDKNIIRPTYGAYKFVETHQDSKLQYRTESTGTPAAVSNLRSPLIHKNLLYDYSTVKKDPSLIPQLDETLKQICEKTKSSIEENAASLMAKTLHLLRHIPGNSIEPLLQRIISGEICSNHHRLEALFLDAIAFVHDPSAVEIMVKELVSGRATEGRAILYIAALHLTPRPNIQAIAALKPLFTSYNPQGSAMLAAASMINTYCRHNPHCQKEATVRQIVEGIGRKLEESCTTSLDANLEQEVLALLKALGNMGIIYTETEPIILKCLQRNEIPITVRVAATQAFRNAQCNLRVTRELVNITTDTTKDTEVRIASYIAAIRCVEDIDMSDMIFKITKEDNTQVRGFILSHLHNLQASSDPHKEYMRYHLTDIVLPVNFSVDFGKYSHNYDMSYYMQSLGLGAAFESDVIFATGSYIPRSLHLNLSSALGGIPINFGEFGTRMEGLEPIIKELFGPKGHLQKLSLGKMINDVISIVKEKGASLLAHGSSGTRYTRSINPSTISNFLKKIYGHVNEQKADMYVRFNGQEMAYGSWSGDLNNFDVRQVAGFLLNSLDDFLDQLTNMNIDTARTAQIKIDHSLSTIQGIPVKLEIEGTALFGLKLNSKLNNLGASESENLVEILPGFSLQLNGFIGFDLFLAKTGLKIKNLVSNNNGISISLSARNKEDLQLEVNIQNEMELFNIESEAYLMKGVRGHPETKIKPQSVRGIRIQSKSCLSNLESALGLQFCYDFDLPNILLSTGLPLGDPSRMKVFLKKTDPAMRGYLFKASTHNDDVSKVMKIQAETPGSLNQRKTLGTVIYNKGQDNQMISVSIESSNTCGSIWINLTQEEEYKALETFIKVNSEGTESIAGIKMDLKTHWEGSEKKIEFNMYNSHSEQFSPDSRVMEIKFDEKSDGRLMTLDVIARTMRNLKSFVDFDFGVGGDFRYSRNYNSWIPKRIRILELHCAVQKLRVTSYIRKEGESRYTSAFKITQGKTDLIGVHAIHNVEGEMGQDIQIKTSAQGNIWDAIYKWSLDLAFARSKRGLVLTINRQADNMKIVDFAALYSGSSEMHNVRFLVDLPEYMKAIKLEGKLTRQRENDYLLWTALTQGQQLLLQVDGPVTASWSLSTSQLATNLKIMALTGRPITFSLAVDMTSKKHVFKVTVKEQENLLIDYQWIYSVDSTQRWTIVTKMNVPVLADCSMQVNLMEKAIEVSIDTLLFPASPYERRITGLTAANLEVMEFKLGVAWNADKKPIEKLLAEIKLTPVPIDANHLVLSGFVTYKNQRYGVSLETSGFEEHPWKREVKMHITNPGGEILKYELALNIVRVGPTSTRVLCSGSYENAEGRSYKFSETLSLSDYYAPGSFKITSQSRYESPEHQVSVLDLETKYIDILSERLLEWKVDLSTPILQSPMMIHFKLDNKIDLYEVIFEGHTDSPLHILKWRILHHPYNGLKSVIFDLDMAAALKLLEKIHVLINNRDENKVKTLEMVKPHKYHITYTTPSAHNHQLVIQTPSRSVEGEIGYAPGEYKVKFHQKSDQSDSKYGIAVTMNNISKTPHNQLVEWQSHISHPSLTRDKKIYLQYKKEGTTMKGKIDIDIFQDEADKITGTMESKRITLDTIWIEATLKARALKFTPHVNITAAYAPHIISFDFKYRKTPTSEVSFQMAGRIDRSHGQEAALALTMYKGTKTVLDLSGSVVPEEGPQCYGLGIRGILHVPHLGLYNLGSKMCNPGFLEITANKHGKSDIFMIKLGYKDPGNVELSFSVEDKDTLQILPILLASVNLPSPTLIEIDFAKATDQLSIVKNLANAELERILSIVPAWMAEIIKDFHNIILLQTTDIPSTEFFKLLEELRREVKAMYSDIVRHVRENPILIRIKPYLMNTLSCLEDLIRKLLSIRNSMDIAFQKNFEGLVMTLVNDIIKLLQMLDGDQSSKIMDWIVSSIEQIPEVRKLQELLVHLIEAYPDDIEGLKQIVSKFIDKMGEDIDNIRGSVTQNRDIQREIIWLMGNYDRVLGLQLDKLITKVLNDLLIISVRYEDHHMKVSIPTHRPVYSLVQAVQFLIPKPVAMFNDILWAFYSFTPTSVKNLIRGSHVVHSNGITDIVPPYNSTAMIVDGKEILTFDGSVLRAPASTCVILLANYESYFLTMEHPQPGASQQLTLAYPDSSITIKPDYTVTINGREMRSHQETQGEVHISRSSGDTIIKTPFMTIHVYSKNNVVSVQITGWTFGQIVGLLGTYDGEVANDWLMPNGSQAPNLQELVRSWQTSQQCQTPSISPVDPLYVPMLKKFRCNAMLQVHSICRSILKPDPLVQMCYAISDVSNAEAAYHALCISKGIYTDFFPSCSI